MQTIILQGDCKKRAVILLAVLLLTMFAVSQFLYIDAYAISDEGIRRQEEAGHMLKSALSANVLSMAIEAKDAKETASAVNKLAKLFFGLAVPVAALGFASLAFSFFTGNEKKAEEAKERAKKCLIAVACLFLLTGIMRIGRGVVKNITWNPNLTGNKTVIDAEKSATETPIVTIKDAEEDSGGE